MTESGAVFPERIGPDPSALSAEDLQACLRDLLGLLALPALWRDRDEPGILESLLGVLEASLPIDLGWTLIETDAARPVRLARVLHGRESPDAPEWRAVFGQFEHATPAAVETPIGRVQLANLPLGYRGSRGRLVLGSSRADFPTPIQSVLLRAAASLAASALDTARILREREQANRAKDEFLAMLGHELRNPLAPIVTALHLMRLRGAREMDRERTIIERQVTHLTRLVDDLLDVARITKGRIELRRRCFETAELVAKAVEMASPLLEQRAHRLSVEVPASGLPVHVDPDRMGQVLLNLLSNAAKYTDSGGDITIAAREQDGWVALSVRDTGIGLDAEMLPKVFDLFSQERQQIARSLGGLGLGLTIVRSLVQLHDGTVSAASEGPGKGSEFVVRLPLASPELLSAAASSQAAPITKRRSTPRRILIVEDNPDAADLFCASLELAGHEVRVASDGAEALRATEDFRPDVAFLDIGLPVMDGYELARELRSRPGLLNIRLIAVTGYGQAADRNRALAAGFDDLLVKPVDPALLESLVDPA